MVNVVGIILIVCILFFILNFILIEFLFKLVIVLWILLIKCLFKFLVIIIGKLILSFKFLEIGNWFK